MWAQLTPLLALLLLAVLAAGVLVAATKPGPDELLGDINHALHLENDLTCVDCHTGVESHSSAGVPSITICVDCHEGESVDDLGGDSNAALIAGHIERNEEIWWPKAYELPDHVLFSHRRHVVLGEVPCKECHGDMEQATSLPVAPIESTLTMEGCMNCHSTHAADLDCWTCHQ